MVDLIIITGKYPWRYTNLRKSTKLVQTSKRFGTQKTDKNSCDQQLLNCKIEKFAILQIRKMGRRNA